MNRVVNALYNANWKKIAKCAVSAGAGAAALGVLGHEFGRDIADLVGVKSQFMGIERAIAGDMIKYMLVTSGAILGVGIAYLHDKKYNK